MSHFSSHLLLYCSVLGGKSFLLCRISAVLMYSYMEMINSVLVAGAIENCIIIIFGEDFFL